MPNHRRAANGGAQTGCHSCGCPVARGSGELLQTQHGEDGRSTRPRKGWKVKESQQGSIGGADQQSERERVMDA